MRWIKNWIRKIAREEIAAQQKETSERVAEHMRSCTPRIRKRTFDAMKRPH